MRTNMNISLPEPLKLWVEQQVKTKGYSTASEYVRDVLRRQHEAEVRGRIDAQLIEGLDGAWNLNSEVNEIEARLGASRAKTVTSSVVVLTEVILRVRKILFQQGVLNERL